MSDSKKSRDYKGSSLTTFENSFTIIDIETTGLCPDYDDIIEVAAIKVVDDKIVDSYSSLVNPGYEIDEFITDLTGITNEMLEQAPSFKSIAEAFINFLGSDILVGHNVHFDINFLYDKYYELNESYIKNDFIDTLRLARKLCKDISHHRLCDLTDYFDISVDTEHRAEADCISTFEVYKELRNKALNQFGTLDEFQKSFKKKSHHNLDLKTITKTTDDIDDSNPLYNKVCVFTGALERFTRKEAAQIVVNLGGICDNSITKKTNYLILGNNDYCKNIKDGKSNKQKKAEAYISKGNDLLIMPESVFYEMIES